MVETALALVTREALDRVERDVHQIIAALLMLAEHHAATPVLARSLAQPVSVTSFGLKCMLWAAPLIRSLQRLQTTAANACSVQLGGLGGMREQMKGAGSQVVAHMATALNLQARPYACDTQRDEWVALGCEMALLVGSLGKMSADLSRMCQFEVNELERSSPDERAGGVSVMPSQAGKKDTTAACLVALTAAQRVPQSMAALLAAMPQEHESAPGNWPALLAEWPTLVM